MIDRDARDCLATLIESYLDEQIAAFEFDEKIQDVAGKSDDEAVRHIAQALWFYYDDCKDHTVVLSKQQWDYFQRLVLLLRSDAEFQVDRLRIWSWRHAVAAIGLAGFVFAAARLGFGGHLFIVAMLFGLLSMLIAWSRPNPSKVHPDEWMRLSPFGSFMDMLAVRRRVASFHKRRYPHELAGKRIRSPLMDRAIWLQSYCLWLLFSPVALLIQSLPDCEERTRALAPNVVLANRRAV
ncbi:MAG: hypothetical protein AB7Q17_14650 [Phycisphaerae bacterium]